MAKNATVPVAGGPAPTQLTDNDCTMATIQNHGPNIVFVKGGGSSAPADAGGGLRLGVGEGIQGLEMIRAFPGASAARLWAFSEGVGCNDAIIHD